MSHRSTSLPILTLVLFAGLVFLSSGWQPGLAEIPNHSPSDPSLARPQAEFGADDVRISHMGTDGSPNAYANSPAAAYNSARHEFLIAWEGTQASPSSQPARIYAQRISPFGWSELGQVDFLAAGNSATQAQADSFDPSLTYNANRDEFLLVYRGNTVITSTAVTAYEVFAQRLDGLGQPLSQPLQVSRMGDVDSDGSSDVLDPPAVAYNPSADQYLLVWSADNVTGGAGDGVFDVYGQLLGFEADNLVELNSAGYSDDLKLTSAMAGFTPTHTWDARRPAVVWNPVSTQYIVAWQADPAAAFSPSIYLQPLGSNGQLAGTPVSVTAGAAGREAHNPALAVDSSTGNVLIAWSDDQAANDTFQILGQLFSSDLASLAGPLPLSQNGSASAPAEAPAVSFRSWDSGTGMENEFLVTWYLSGEQNRIYAQRLTPALADAGEADSLVGTGAGLAAALAYSPIPDAWMVVWPKDFGAGEMEIAGQMVGKPDQSPPTVSLAPIAPVVQEGSQPLDLTLTLSDTTSVDWNTIDSNDLVISGTNTLTGSFSTPLSLQSTSPNTHARSLAAVYRFSPPGGSWDFTDNGVYTVTIKPAQLADVRGNTVPAQSPGVISVDIPYLEFATQAFTASETVAAANVITITRHGDASRSLQAQVAITGGTATAGQDYTASGFPKTVTLAPGEMEKAVSVPLLDDPMDEYDEDLLFSLTGINGANVGSQNTAVITITSNDLPPAVSLSASAASMSENGGTTSLYLNLSNPSGKQLTVNLDFSGQAVSGLDYEHDSLPVIIPPGTTQGLLSLAARSDVIDEPDEGITATVQLTGSANLTLGEPASLGFVLIDDDEPPQVTLSLSASSISENGGSAELSANLETVSAFPVVVTPTLAGTAIQETDYRLDPAVISLAPGETQAGLTLLVVDDSLAESSETVQITNDQAWHATPDGSQLTLTITDNDSPVIAENNPVSVSLDEDSSPEAFSLSLHASDANGDPLTWSQADPPAHGQAVAAGSGSTLAVEYTPDPDYYGTDSFRVQVSDGTGGQAEVQINLVIRSIPDAPVIQETAPVTVVMDEDGDPTPFALTLHASDADQDTLTWQVANPPGHGTAGAAGSGDSLEVSYLPASNYNGPDDFTVQVSDVTGRSAQVTVQVTVRGINDAPAIAPPGEVSIQEGSPLTLTVEATDPDPGDHLTLALEPPLPYGVGFDPATRTFAWTPGELQGPGVYTFTLAVRDDGLPPQTTRQTFQVTVTEDNQAPLAVGDLFGLTEGGQLSVPSAGVLGNDSDPDNNSLQAQVANPPLHGTLDLSANGSFTYQHDGSETAGDAFTYRASDGLLQSEPVTVTLDLTPVNDPPQPQPDSATLLEDASRSIPVLANDLDPENDSLSVVAVVQPLHGSAQIEVGGRVRYTPAPDYYGLDQFSYTVADTQGGQAQAQVSLVVTEVNDPPAAVDDSASTQEDQALEIAVLANDSDPNGDALQIISASHGLHGRTLVLPGGGLFYTPQANYAGRDEFSYQVQDGRGGQDLGVVTIVIAPVNDVPLAADDTATTPPGQAVDIPVLANDTDLDGDPLQVTAVGPAAYGRPALASAGTITFTPGPAFKTTDTFTYTVSDNQGASASASVRILAGQVAGAITAAPDRAATREDIPVGLDPLANDSTPSGKPLSLLSATRPANGSVLVAGSRLIYTPNPDFNGQDTFTYFTSDNLLQPVSAEVTIVVQPVNDPPRPAGDALTIDAGQSTGFDPLANDRDPDSDPLTLIAFTPPQHGVVTLSGGSRLSYQPTPRYHGPDRFTYTVADPSGAAAVGVVDVTIAPANHAPIAVQDAVRTAEDTRLTLNPLENDSDPDGDALSLQSTGQGWTGSVSIQAGRLVYTPAADFNGSDTFVYTIADTQGMTATAAVLVTVDPVVDPPVSVPDAGFTGAASPLSMPVLQNDISQDGSPLVLLGYGQPAFGQVGTGTDGALIYTPFSGFSGVDTYTYTMGSSFGAPSGRMARTQSSENQVGRVTILVGEPGSAVTAADDSAATLEDTPVSISPLTNDSGEDLQIVGLQPGLGRVRLQSSAQLIYTPPANFSGTDLITYTLTGSAGSGASGHITVTVSPQNDAPRAAGDSLAAVEDTSSEVDVLANDSDPDGDSLTLAGFEQPLHGQVAIANGSRLRYTPDPDFAGGDQFGYTIADGQGEFATAMVQVTVEPQPDSPRPAADLAAVPAGSPVRLPVLSNDQDPDGETLTLAAVSQPASGYTALVSGQVIYTPTLGITGTEVFTYRVSDGSLEASAPVTVTVLPVSLAQSDLSLTAQASNHQVLSGSTLVYTLTVANLGPAAASQVSLSDALPPELSWVGGSPACSESSGRVTCRLGQLAPGDAQTVVLTATLSSSASGTVANQAVVSALEDDPNPLNNQAVVQVDALPQIVVFEDDLESTPSSLWVDPRSSRSPSGAGFLGEFGNQTVQLRLDNLPEHGRATISFDLYILRSWDGIQVESQSTRVGPDEWIFQAGGRPLLHTTFANWSSFLQDYPYGFRLGQFPAQTGAGSVNQLGYSSHGQPMDAVYHLSYTLDHTSSSLLLEFLARGLQSLSDESWGLDNVRVSLTASGTQPFRQVLPVISK